METTMNQIRELVRGQSNEEKVAGLLLAHKLLSYTQQNALPIPSSPPSSSVNADEKVFVADVIVSLRHEFIAGLLNCKSKSVQTDPTKSGALPSHKLIIQRAAIDLLGYAVNWNILHRDMATLLLDVWFKLVPSDKGPKVLDFNISSDPMENGDDDKISEEFVATETQLLKDILLIVKWTAKSAEQARPSQSMTGRNLLDYTLQKSLSSAGSIPALLMPSFLDFIADLASIETTQPALNTNPAAAEALQFLLATGFHGGAPEAVRDASLSCCQQLLSCRGGGWTVERSVPPDSPIALTHHSSVGRFAMLLISVVGVEVHLLLEEALALCEVPTVGGWDTGGSGDAPNQPTALSPNVGASRARRVKKMLPCCLALLDQCLALLVGRAFNDTGDDITAEGIWSHFHSPTMLHIRQSAHSILQKLFDFLRDAAAIQRQEVQANPTSAHMSPSDVTSLSHQSVAALSLWACEDESLWKPYLENVPLLLRWSRALPSGAAKLPATSGATAGAGRRGEVLLSATAAADDETTWKTLFGEDLDACTTSATEAAAATRIRVNPGPSSSPESSSRWDANGAITTSATTARTGDCIHYVIPCLAAIAGTLSVEENATECGILCSADGTLLPRVLYIIVLTAQRVSVLAASLCSVSEVPSAVQSPGTQRSKMVRICQTATAACDLVGALLTWKEKEVKALWRGVGGDDAAALLEVFTHGASGGGSGEGSTEKILLPPVPGGETISYLRRLGDVLAVASGTTDENIRGKNQKKNMDKKSVAALTTLDAAMCGLIDVLDTFTE